MPSTPSPTASPSMTNCLFFSADSTIQPHHAPAVSPGFGIIALTHTIIRPVARARGREARERLSDENNVASFPDGAGDGVRIGGETGMPVVARQIDREGFVPRRANEGDHAVP